MDQTLLVEITASGVFFVELVISKDGLEKKEDSHYTISNLELKWRMMVPVSYDKPWKLVVGQQMERSDLKDSADIGCYMLIETGQMNAFQWRDCENSLQCSSVMRKML